MPPPSRRWEIAPARDERHLREIQGLAQKIWWEHYPDIISKAQIHYMLERGYSVEVMRAELQTAGIRYDRLLCDGELIGFSSYGPTDADRKLKIHKLYVRSSHRHAGGARALVDRIDEFARASGFRAVTLQVNKRNRTAIAAYEKLDFGIRKAVVVDIGGGFVMDDYVMERAPVAARAP